MPPLLDKLARAQLGNSMRVIQPSQFDLDSWNGRLLCFEAPEPHEIYAMAIDPGGGVGGDRTVCQVLKLGTIKHPDVQVAELACDFMDPVDFASVANTIGRWYADPDGTEAFCTVETNFHAGETILSELRYRWDYSNFYIRRTVDRLTSTYTNIVGWSTNKASRPKLIARGLHALQYGDLVIRSPHLVDEMSDFRQDHFDDKPEARRSRHDDRIMALLMCYYGAHEDEWLNGVDIGELRRATSVAETIIEAKAPDTRKIDYQSRPVKLADINADWENRFFAEID
jgi:hypothetical protein